MPMVNCSEVQIPTSSVSMNKASAQLVECGASTQFILLNPLLCIMTERHSLLWGTEQAPSNLVVGIKMPHAGTNWATARVDVCSLPNTPTDYHWKCSTDRPKGAWTMPGRFNLLTCLPNVFNRLCDLNAASGKKKKQGTMTPHGSKHVSIPLWGVRASRISVTASMGHSVSVRNSAHQHSKSIPRPLILIPRLTAVWCLTRLVE